MFAKGAKTIAADKPAATRPPAAPPLPGSPPVSTSICCCNALRPFLVSEPNIASRVSSP